MSNTGVSVAQECISKFQEFKLRKTNKYITFKINDKLTEIVIDKAGEPSASYDEFLSTLPDNDCRYAVVTVDYTTEKEGDRTKIVFFLWAPDSSKVKSKMLYAGTKDTMKKALNGINTEVQGCDKSEVDISVVIERCKLFSQ